ncbi:MAG TPA: hypothetical protein VGK74_16690 [Symbiobacteriaceae bacterium]|jgi:hypothetical protein
MHNWQVPGTNAMNWVLGGLLLLIAAVVMVVRAAALRAERDDRHA